MDQITARTRKQQGGTHQSLRSLLQKLEVRLDLIVQVLGRLLAGQQLALGLQRRQRHKVARAQTALEALHARRIGLLLRLGVSARTR